MSAYVILSAGAFDYILNKTGNMLLRYKPEEVVAVIDPKKAGLTAREVLGYGGNIPVVKSFAEARSFSPDTLVLGNAPQGGFISDLYRKEIVSAIESGCDIISGMHEFLNDDAEISELAKKRGVRLVDLRRPPKPPHFPKGTWMQREVPVLLTIGTDCDTGKMTTAWELTLRLREKGRKVNFVGTGQTGILLGGFGVPIDAVVADFMAGEMEYAIDQAAQDADLVVVEGQGAITNMLYSGVTLGLLHGSMPDYILIADEPGRKLDVADYPMVDIGTVMNLHRDLMSPFKNVVFVGANLLTYKLSETEALQVIADYEQRLNLPVTDLVRFGNRNLIDYIDRLLS
ncbi:MAG: DUF1611 domain-containing protein [FCB group bacterium]|nr:DUF1611 domain-containing protein [FCB group bacterium]